MFNNTLKKVFWVLHRMLIKLLIFNIILNSERMRMQDRNCSSVYSRSDLVENLDQSHVSMSFFHYSRDKAYFCFDQPGAAFLIEI